MKYKVGDKVKIKSLEWYNENKNDFGLIFCNNICFDEKMIEFCGKTVTIVAQRNDKYYYIKEDNCLSFWSSFNVKPLILILPSSLKLFCKTNNSEFSFISLQNIVLPQYDGV